MAEIIQDLSPEWRMALSEVSQLKEIPLQEAFDLARRTQHILRLNETEEAISFLLESTRFQQRFLSSNTNDHKKI